MSKKKQYSINVCYPFDYYPKLDGAIDWYMEQNKVNEFGSGMGMGDRDLQYGPITREVALKHKKYIETKFKKYNVKVEIEAYD